MHQLKLKTARRRLSQQQLHQEQRARQTDVLTIQEAAERAQQARLARELLTQSASMTVTATARTTSSPSTKETHHVQPQASQAGDLKRSAKRALPVAPAVEAQAPIKRPRAAPKPEVVAEEPPPPPAYVPLEFVPTARSELVEEF